MSCAIKSWQITCWEVLTGTHTKSSADVDVDEQYPSAICHNVAFLLSKSFLFTTIPFFISILARCSTLTQKWISFWLLSLLFLLLLLSSFNSFIWFLWKIYNFKFRDATFLELNSPDLRIFETKILQFYIFSTYFWMFGVNLWMEKMLAVYLLCLQRLYFDRLIYINNPLKLRKISCVHYIGDIKNSEYKTMWNC